MQPGYYNVDRGKPDNFLLNHNKTRTLENINPLDYNLRVKRVNNKKRKTSKSFFRREETKPEKYINNITNVKLIPTSTQFTSNKNQRNIV